jgi:hypothetical protein
MKKFLLIIIGVLLLLPTVIYFGNLADIPEAKEIIVHLRDLVGMSAEKERINFGIVNLR